MHTQLNAQDRATIESLVRTHCESSSLIPQGMVLKIEISLVPAPSVIVESIEAIPDESVLNQHAAESFSAYWSKEDPKARHGTVANVFRHIEHNSKAFVTVRDVILYRNNLCPDLPLDRQWLRLRTLGNKGLTMIDQWLESMNLRRGMELPPAKE